MQRRPQNTKVKSYPKILNRLIWNAFPTLFDIPNPPPKIEVKRLLPTRHTKKKKIKYLDETLHQQESSENYSTITKNIPFVVDSMDAINVIGGDDTEGIETIEASSSLQCDTPKKSGSKKMHKQNKTTEL